MRDTSMTDYEIVTKIRHRLLAELNRLVAELLLLEDDANRTRLLELQRHYQDMLV